MKSLRKAESADLPAVLQIIAEARRFLGQSGSDQWQKAYPAKSDIEQDLALGYGFVLLADATVAGYCAIITGEEPAYTAIQRGAWLNDSRDYVTVHRIAIADRFRGRGLTRVLWREIFSQLQAQGYRDFRVDTHPENLIMQKMLAREGFEKRGVVQFEGLRWAYQCLREADDDQT